MTEPGNKKSIDFDEIQLHSDADIGRSPEPTTKAKPEPKTVEPKSGGGAKTAVFVVLFLAAAGAAGYFYWQWSDLRNQFTALEAKASATGANLDNTKTGLADAIDRGNNLQGDVDKLQTENSQLQKDKRALGEDKKELTSQLASANKKAGDLQKRVNNLQKNLADTRKEKQRVDASLAKVRTDAKSAEEQASAAILDLETRLNDSQQTYQSNQADWDRERSTLRTQLRTAESERDRIQRSFDEESQASLALIREQNELKTQASNLGSQVRSLEAQLTDVREQLARERRVDIGELVPYSESLRPGEVRYREPLPDGQKVPRRLGAVAVQVLISEVGAVEKAFVIGDQPVEAELSAAITKAMYNWKFTPPTLEGVKVKAWQTVLIRAE